MAGVAAGSQQTARRSSTKAAPPQRRTLAEAIRDAYSGRLTQVQLANTLGVAQNTVSRWSTGDVEPRLDDIARIEAACSLPHGFILRSAGCVDDASTPEDMVAADHRLDAARRELLLAAYAAALSQTRRAR